MKKLNILFLSLIDFKSFEESNIYTDLLAKFIANGHYITAISPVEKRNYVCENDIINEDYSILKPMIGNIQKTNIIEKGISMIVLEKKILKRIKKLDTKFDLIIYSTPPVTFSKCIKYIKKRDNSTSYLLLKDIFPQNAIDLGILSKKGIKSLLYFYFRLKEKSLYKVSDYIGCMSNANKDYIIKHNKNMIGKVEINPNSERDLEIRGIVDKNNLLKKYGIPQKEYLFVYGGNLGKPQGIEFFKRCIASNEERMNSLFLIVGSGTEYISLKDYIYKNNIKNTLLLSKLPKNEFEKLVRISDVGLIFLDYRFTIPNIPSRILTYMKLKKPVLMAIDKSTDIGEIARQSGFGDYCYSNDLDDFNNLVHKFIKEYDLTNMGEKAYGYFKNNYLVDISYYTIIKKMEMIS